MIGPCKECGFEKPLYKYRDFAFEVCDDCARKLDNTDVRAKLFKDWQQREEEVHQLVKALFERGRSVIQNPLPKPMTEAETDTYAGEVLMAGANLIEKLNLEQLMVATIEFVEHSHE